MHAIICYLKNTLVGNGMKKTIVGISIITIAAVILAGSLILMGSKGHAQQSCRNFTLVSCFGDFNGGASCACPAGSAQVNHVKSSRDYTYWPYWDHTYWIALCQPQS